MSAARTAATRQEVIEAAALLFGDDMPHWTRSEYVRGICEVIADSFGADVEDHDHAKDEVWTEIAARLAGIKLARNTDWR